MKATRRNLFALAAGAVAAPAELLKAPKTGWTVAGHMTTVTPYLTPYHSDFSTDAWRVRLVMRWEESFRNWRGTHGV